MTFLHHVGRISTLFGLSQSGKSLIAANTAVRALQDDKVDKVIIFDSEGGQVFDVIPVVCWFVVAI